MISQNLLSYITRVTENVFIERPEGYFLLFGKTEIIFRLDFTVTDKIVVEVMQKHKLIVAFTTSNNAVWMRISVNCYK